MLAPRSLVRGGGAAHQGQAAPHEVALEGPLRVLPHTLASILLHRWANEQARMWEPHQGPTALDADAWDDALELLDACGPDSRAQLCRTTSTEQGPVTPRPLGSPMGSGLSACMLAESKPEVSPALPCSLGRG